MQKHFRSFPLFALCALASIATGLPLAAQVPGEAPNPRVIQGMGSEGPVVPVSSTPAVIEALLEERGPAPVNLAIVVLDLVENFMNASRTEPVDFFYITAGQIIYIDDAQRSSASQLYPYYDSFPLTVYAERPKLPTEENPEPVQPRPVARLNSLPDSVQTAVFVMAERPGGGFSSMTIPLPPIQKAQASILNFTEEAMAVSIEGNSRELAAKSQAVIPLGELDADRERTIFQLAMRHEKNGKWRKVYARRLSFQNDENAVILIYKPTSGTQPFRVLPILDLKPKPAAEPNVSPTFEGG